MNTPYFPALEQFITLQSDHDPYILIDNPATGVSVKVRFSELSSKLKEIFNLSDLKDVGPYTNNSYLTINGSGVPTFTLVSTTAKSLIGINCSANPAYPAATVGDRYIVTQSGKIGGAFFGQFVETGDIIECITTNPGGSAPATGASYSIIPNPSLTTATVNFGGSPFTVADRQEYIDVDCTAGNVSIILPSGTTLRNYKRFHVRKIDSSGNKVVVSIAGGQTINGAASVDITTQYQMGIFENRNVSYVRIVL